MSAAQRIVAVLAVSAIAALAAAGSAHAQKGSASGATRLAPPSNASPGGPVGNRGLSTNLLDPSGAPPLPAYRANDRLRNAGPNSENPGAGPGGLVKKPGAAAKSKKAHPDFLWSPTSNPSADRSNGRYYVNGATHKYSTGASRDSRPGTGVLKSTDGGSTWSKRKPIKSIGGLKNEHDMMD